MYNKGDAYTAKAVAKKTGTASWMVYNIFRDHLGTITHLKTGSTITEYSFDAWGRRRDKDTWSYTLSSEPALFADRGFTAHEFLPDFNLYNMLSAAKSRCSSGNGRLYDPVVGRFLSPDPYVQAPGFTQSYNRYSYCLNNPLNFTDPSGEIFWPAIWFGNWVLGGMNNWINKGMPIKQAFSLNNNPAVAGVNYHFTNNIWSNTQASAQNFVKQDAVNTRTVNDIVAGLKGMDLESPLFGDLSPGAFVGESSLANGVALSTYENKRKPLAFGVTDDFTFAFGPGGISFEFGTFSHNEIEYSVASLGYAAGWDISAGINTLFIKGNPDTFNPYDLQGWSTQRNGSIWHFSSAYEIPFERAYKPYNLDTYRIIAPGATIGTNFLGGSMVWGYTWIYKTPKAPTLTDIYKSRPGGY